MTDSSDATIPEENLRDYDRIIESVFHTLVASSPQSEDVFSFTLDDVTSAAQRLGIALRNRPDVVYTYRTGRASLPQSILGAGHWAIQAGRKGYYQFVRLSRSPYVDIPADLAIIRLLDSTPQLVLKFQGADEQAVLARIRYNRLVDIFTSLTAYHIQGHFRTALSQSGQVEIDDLYMGLDAGGKAYVVPIEAKSAGTRERLGVVQVTQLVQFAHRRFPGLPVRPVGVKVLDGSYVFLEFNETENMNDVATTAYRRYELYREK
ncbi:MAG: hypothetical protein IT323_01810 [Anaerolineae bacterium]|nr:hypothetical protein [Anaerolineae bacterium]